MNQPMHPPDERLAALAGDDPDATADAELTAHVASCDRCGPVVADLAALRAALAELPDIAPSRPIQLLPPVREVPTTSGAPWWRRLAAPAMAAGAVLVVVGAIGFSGATENLAGALSAGAAGASAPAERNDGDSVSAPSPANAGGSGEEETPPRPITSPQAESSEPPFDAGGTGWLYVLGGGAAVLGGGIGLRAAARREPAPGTGR